MKALRRTQWGLGFIPIGILKTIVCYGRYSLTKHFVASETVAVVRTLADTNDYDCYCNCCCTVGTYY